MAEIIKSKLINADERNNITYLQDLERDVLDTVRRYRHTNILLIRVPTSCHCVHLYLHDYVPARE